MLSICSLYALKARAKAIYQEDANKPMRKSHENPYIIKLYEEFSNKKKKVRLLGIKLSNLEKNLKAKQTILTSYVIF